MVWLRGLLALGKRHGSEPHRVEARLCARADHPPRDCFPGLSDLPGIRFLLASGPTEFPAMTAPEPQLGTWRGF